MQYDDIIIKLKQNKEVFNRLLQGVSREEYLWKLHPDKWCILEILCHLCDEEKEDFRTRVKCVLESPDQAPPSIDPVGWVKGRHYIEQDFDEKLEEFLEERDLSVKWLESLESPKWDNAYVHPKLGPMSAYLFLSNWLAHDYLHFRQIIRVKYDYLGEISGENLKYAGKWI